ncbi:UDP-Glycosyltransferase/glycogen phosphorylase [Gigaspora margarita]|uniref:UDP-Glycosyltransferase/glycogen phosphorylase n=1 Tax=Gigaspora margarita TaxID=4874 RepID=A0A8H4EQG0_GIGMA|nr:UDP-Glycosyltransferase/glycogen phosphorylase [Gigaspora margarita]
MENENFYSRFKCKILSPLQSIWMALTTVRDLNIQRAKVGVEPHWDPKGRISNILMLFDTFFGYEVPSAESPLYQEIGPILSDTYPGLTPTLNSFLNEHPRTMYFAIGTIALLSPQSTSILLKSFLELIDHDIIDGVIWATTRMNTTELLSLNNSDIPISQILNNNHPHIHITKHAPQFAILSHKNTKIFLNHGGAGSCQESIYNAKPMLIIPACCDHFGNAERMELAGMALKISKDDLNVNDIVSKLKRLLNDESFKLNAERLQFSSKINSKRKYRGADLIEIILNNAMYEGVKDENGGFKIDNENFLKDWITPDIKMGYIKGNYLDVYFVAMILFLVFFGAFTYTSFNFTKYFYILYTNGNINFKKYLKSKKE